MLCTKVIEHRRAGLVWVVRADIDDCFPSIDRAALGVLLQGLLSTPTWELVARLLDRRSWSRGRRAPVDISGLPQGSPLSPAFANLALTSVDEALADEGLAFVRYGDDIAVLTRTRDDAEHALGVLRRAVERIAMRLGDDDTQIMSFEQGFVFLGEEFGPRYPPDVPGFRVQQPLERSLYVARPGCRVSVEEGQVRVSVDGEEILSAPTGHVARLVLFGPSGLSAGARSWALANDVPVVLCSQRGNYLGQLVGPPSQVTRRLRQADLRHDAAWRTKLGMGIVGAKLRHQITLLRRFVTPDAKDAVADTVAAIRRLADMLPDAATTEEVMGLEGAGARAYFECWPSLLPAGITFSGRNRRPPLDTLNSALGWSYTVLHGEAVAALCAAGLDPAIGIFHEPHDRQFTLASDLMEEFRPLVVDAAMFALIRASDLRDDHGRHVDHGGVLLTAEGRGRVAGAYERRMVTVANGARVGFKGSYRRLLYIQAQQLAAAVDHSTSAWDGLSWR
ncbi:MAG: CRISPR-associated endonuclease Cas1 [Pseudonocardiales bacterium]|nr:MAG: CRISPR-associated endonuclease Cas1 [Pseudonocardiales bacterium]